jgi:hypothetical protein
MLGSAEHDGKYADLYGSDWIGLLRRGLGADCLELGITELDASVLQGSTARALTQRASRLVFRNAFDGIYYRSKFGHDIQNWALFEPFKLFPKHPRPINLADPELLRALAIHHLRLTPGRFLLPGGLGGSLSRIPEVFAPGVHWMSGPPPSLDPTGERAQRA